MSKTCPSCKRPASGRFCSHCGAAVAGPAACRACSARLQPGARFCNECGSPMPWVVAAIALVALLGAVLVPRFRGEAPTGGTPRAPAAMDAVPTGGQQPVDLASMTPRQAADRLFDRVMRTASQGDTAQALSFVPMALDAYGMLDAPDADAWYHVGVLHLLNGAAEQARGAADRILADDPGHLFGLFTAAQAARELGQDDEARDLFQQFLDRYPTELARELPEYDAHSPAFPEMRAEAQAAVR